jgi:hypothetical protein
MPIHYRTLATAYQFDAVKTMGAATLIEPGDTHAAKIMSSQFDAEFNQVETKLPVFSAENATELKLICPSGATAVLVTRTYDAGVTAPKLENVFLNGKKIGSLFEAYANPKRRFAEDAVWIDLKKSDCAQGLNLALKPDHGTNPGWNAVHYAFQLFASGKP